MVGGQLDEPAQIVPVRLQCSPAARRPHRGRSSTVPAMDLDAIRRLALALPEAHEAPHFDLTSFRVGSKIFATAPLDGDVVRIFVDESEARACVAEGLAGVELLLWGEKISGVGVTLSTADSRRVAELLEESWRRRAPKRLVAQNPSSWPGANSD